MRWVKISANTIAAISSDGERTHYIKRVQPEVDMGYGKAIKYYLGNFTPDGYEEQPYHVEDKLWKAKEDVVMEYKGKGLSNPIKENDEYRKLFLKLRNIIFSSASRHDAASNVQEEIDYAYNSGKITRNELDRLNSRAESILADASSDFYKNYKNIEYKFYNQGMSPRDISNYIELLRIKGGIARWNVDSLYDALDNLVAGEQRERESGKPGRYWEGRATTNAKRKGLLEGQREAEQLESGERGAFLPFNERNDEFRKNPREKYKVIVAGIVVIVALKLFSRK